MAIKLKIWDARMFLLIDNTVGRVPGFDLLEDFVEAIEFPSVSNLKQIRDGKSSFRLNHFMAACKRFNLSMDWFMGFTNEMHRKGTQPAAIELLEAAVAALKLEGAVNRTVNSSSKTDKKIIKPKK